MKIRYLLTNNQLREIDAMKLRELENVIYDEVVVYKRVGSELVDFYKGEPVLAKDDVLDLVVISIGAKKKQILDILVI